MDKLFLTKYFHCRGAVIYGWMNSVRRKRDHMLWTIAVVLVILWMLGLASSYTTGNFIHSLLFFAIVAMLIQIEDDCSDYDSGRTRKRFLKRQLIYRTRKILPKLATISQEKGSQPIISPETYREE